MSATRTTTRTSVRGAPGRPGAPGAPGGAPAVSAQQEPENRGPDYSERPNAPPKTEEAVPSVEWARWRLYKQRPDIKDKFPEYFPDVRKQLYDRLEAEVQEAKEDVPATRFEKRFLEELNDGYKPKQLGFAPLTQFYIEADQQNARLSRRQRLDSDDEGDRIPSLWFERMAQDLFARVWEFCSDTFGLGATLEKQLDEQDWTLRWLDKLPKEFVVLASQVARGDMTVVVPKSYDPNNWEFLFLDDKSRVKLMVGVMAKLLEENLFNSLLCGAADVEQTALTADDHARAFLDNSYQRNRTRSETVRNYIQANRAPLGIGLRDLFTDNFWIEVDSITMGILDLLLPLINLLGQDMPDTPWPPLKRVHQRLHDIVAEAAWFTNGMRATKSIFWIQFPLPGELNDISHEHAIDDIWKRSKTSAEAHDKEVQNQWKTKRDAKIRENNPGEAMNEALRAAYEADHPRPYVRRTAKVQVAMWPFIKRFTPMRERDAGDGAYNTGETITQIMKAQCVYYNGDDSDDADMKERRTLSEQISSHRWAKWTTTRALLIYALIFGLFLLYTSPEIQQGLHSQSPVVNMSSSSQEYLKERKTTTIVAVPVGTEIVTETVVVTDSTRDEDKPSKPWFGSKAPSVSKVTETVTETIVKRSDGGADDNNDDDNNDDHDDHDSDDDSDNGRSGSVTTEEGIAAKLVSAKDKVTDSIASAKDRVTDGVASAKDKVTDGVASAKDEATESIASARDRIASKFASDKDRVASIESYVRESVSNSIADENSRSSAASKSSADEESSSLAASRNSVKESRSSKSASRSSTRENSAASQRSADESDAARRSSTRESKSASKRSDDESKSSERSSANKRKESSRSSVAAEESAEAERIAAAERSAEAERIAASESKIISEKVAASLAAEDEARRVAASIASEESEKASSSSSATKKRAHSRKTTSKDSVVDTTTVVTNVGNPVSVEDVTTGKISAPSEKDKETITITVPADKVVVTVTGPATQAETKGTVRTAVDKATKQWCGIVSWCRTDFSFGALLRYMLVSFIGPYGSLLVVVLVIVFVALKPRWDEWRRKRNLRARGGAAKK